MDLPIPETLNRRMTDECYHEVAEQTLEDDDVIDTMARVDRDVCAHVKDTIISKATKFKINLHTTTPDQAGAFIRDGLKDSEEPQKMAIFLDKLKQPNKLHAEKMSKIYDQYIREHRCDKCREPLPDACNEEPEA